jgi:hypothetical protein
MIPPPAPDLAAIERIRQAALYDQATKVLQLVDQSTDLAGSAYLAYHPLSHRYFPTAVVSDAVPESSTIVANGEKGVHVTFQPGNWDISTVNAHQRHPSLNEIQGGTTLTRYPKGLLHLDASRLVGQFSGRKETDDRWAFINKHLLAFKITCVGNDEAANMWVGGLTFFAGGDVFKDIYYRFEYNPESITARTFKALGLEHLLTDFIPSTDAAFITKLDSLSLTTGLQAGEIAKQLGVRAVKTGIGLDEVRRRANFPDSRPAG